MKELGLMCESLISLKQCRRCMIGAVIVVCDCFRAMKEWMGCWVDQCYIMMSEGNYTGCP